MDYNEEKKVELESEIRKLDQKEKSKQDYLEVLEEKVRAKFAECDIMLDRSMRIANAMIAMEKQEKKQAHSK